MAKYTVEHSCGHTHTHQLVGPGRQREWRLNRLATEDCPECVATGREAARAERNAEAAARAAGLGLPELLGSERQVAWGNTIRDGLLSEVRGWVERLKEFTEAGDAVRSLAAAYTPGDLDHLLILCDALNETGSGHGADEAERAFRAAVRLVRTEGRASWWIDNRGHLGSRRGVVRVAAERGAKREADLAESLRRDEVEQYRESVRRRLFELMPGLTGFGLEVGTWSGSKRVYLKGPGGFEDRLCDLHVTGDARHSPGQAVFYDDPALPTVAREAVRGVLVDVAGRYKTIEILGSRPAAGEGG